MRVAKSGSVSGSGTSGIGCLVLEALLGHLEAGLQVEDGLAVLDGDHTSGGEGAAVADAVDLVEDRHVRVAGAEEVGVQRVDATGPAPPCGPPPRAPARPPGRRTPAGAPRRATRPGTCSPRSARGRAASPSASTASCDMRAILAYASSGTVPPHAGPDAFPRGSDGAPPPPPTRSRAATSTTTGGAGSTRPARAARSRAATAATAGTAGPRTSRCCKELGFTDYRFSLEWSRIEPAEGEFSTVALDHYARLCEGLREAGIAPVVTFHHFTTPLWLADQGGWERDDMPERFAAYCEKAAARLDGPDGAGLHDQRAEHGGHHRLPRRRRSRPGKQDRDAAPPRQRGVRAVPPRRASTPSAPTPPACRSASRWR